MKSEWIFSDLNIPQGATLKCFLKIELLPEYLIYIKCKKEYYKYYDSKIDMSTFTVFELREKLSELYGFPLSIFRLKPDDINNNVEMLDDHRVIDYGELIS